MRQLRARAQNPYSPSPPNRPQSVSQSLSPVPHLRLSRALPSHVLARTLAPSFWLHRLPSLSAISIRPPPPRALCSLTLLFPPPHSHGNFFLFYAALYRCSCLLTHSLLQFFRRSLRSSRGVSPSSLSFLSFVRGKRSCSHPSYGFLSILPIQLYIHPSPAPPDWSSRLSVLHPPPRSHPPSPPHISRTSFRRLYLKH